MLPPSTSSVGRNIIRAMAMPMAVVKVDVMCVGDRWLNSLIHYREYERPPGKECRSWNGWSGLSAGLGF